MASIPQNYPHGCKDEEISQVIKELCDDILKAGANINTVLRLTPLVELGQGEIQKRIIDRSAKTSGRLATIAIIVATISVVMSGVAVYFSYVSITSSAVWQTEQLKILREIRDGTSSQQK